MITYSIPRCEIPPQVFISNNLKTQAKLVIIVPDLFSLLTYQIYLVEHAEEPVYPR
jgi:hypothetical protein